MNKELVNRRNTREWIKCNDDTRAHYNREQFIGMHGGEFTQHGRNWLWSEKPESNEAKRYILTDSEGTEYIAENLAKFCRDNDLNRAAMFKVLKGDRSHHKGYTIKREGE
jgi:hypothetical protein|tara:strand:- start:1098 stop:1427 length:330 start_codon:yes stop_codon:yes gene_type:complete